MIPAMNRVILTASAAGVAYKVTGIVGMIIGKSLEKAAENYFFSSHGLASHDADSSISSNNADLEYAEIVSKLSPQYILMELDVEAKVSYATSLVNTVTQLIYSKQTGETDSARNFDGESLDQGHVEGNRTRKLHVNDVVGKNGDGELDLEPDHDVLLVEGPNDLSQDRFLKICLNNMSEICDKLLDTLHNKIYRKMDRHREKYFASWRKLDLTQELLLLRSQCRVFDTRMKRLTESLSVEATLANSHEGEGHWRGKLHSSIKKVQQKFVMDQKDSYSMDDDVRVVE